MAQLAEDARMSPQIHYSSSSVLFPTHAMIDVSAHNLGSLQSAVFTIKK